MKKRKLVSIITAVFMLLTVWVVPVSDVVYVESDIDIDLQNPVVDES